MDSFFAFDDGTSRLVEAFRNLTHTRLACESLTVCLYLAELNTAVFRCSFEELNNGTFGPSPIKPT